MSGALVRRAVPGDLDAVAGLEREGLGDDAWSEALVAAGLAGDLPTVAYLVAQDGSEVVGHAVVSLPLPATSAADPGLDPDPDTDPDPAELQRLAVAADRRRGGLASALLEAVAALAREAGAERLLLEVREDNAGARAFYAARGFGEIARRSRYYRDGTAAVVLERALVGPETKVWTVS
ncbi:GNAT family N-acetyltransferase [Nocardioides kribbensis]|uniref:GNAT family N-acetyltransferase n=1 Tax=Nocardioides kribbensis TaxID=305517 RepID=A0ABV1P444_9ACTN